MYVKLQSGLFDQATAEVNGSAPSETPTKLEKRCLIVYPGKFMSMDGEVEVTNEQIEKLASNHNGIMKSLARMAEGVGAPMRACPPVQLDHSTSAKDTVGRVVGDLEVGEHELEDGSKVKALFGKALILGKENVEKVMDGRWAHLSIGADFEEGKLSELTITPFPAAANASMLSKNAFGRVLKYKDGSIEVISQDEDGVKFKVSLKDLSQSYDEDISAAMAIEKGKKIIDGWISDNLSKMSSAKLSKKGNVVKRISYKGYRIEVTEADGPGFEVWLDGDTLFPDNPTFMTTREAVSSAQNYLDDMESANLSQDQKSVQTYKGHEVTIEKADENTYHVSVDGESLPGGKPQKTSAAAMYMAKKYIDESKLKGNKMSKLGAFYKVMGVSVEVKKKSNGGYYWEAEGQKSFGMFDTEAAAYQAAEVFIKKNPDGFKTHKNHQKMSAQPAPSEKGDPMKTGFKKYLSEECKMSDEEVEAKHEKMRKRLMDKEELSEEDADKKLSEMPSDDCKKMSAEADEDDKKLAAEDDEDEDKLSEEEDEEKKKLAEDMDKQEKKLSRARKQLTKLKAGLIKNQETIKLAQKRSEIKTKLSSLRASAKITPAEIKKIDIDSMAKASPEAVKLALGMFEAREPQVLVGLYGNANATEIAKVAEDRQKKTRLAKMEVEARKNMGREISDDLRRLAAGEETETNIHIDTTPHVDVDADDEKDFLEMKKLMVENKDDDAKKVMRRMTDRAMKKLGSEQGSESAAELNTVSDEIKQMHAQVEETIKLVSLLSEE